MKVNKLVLHNHFEMISGGGLISDVLLTDEFAATALNNDQGFMVHTVNGVAEFPTLEDPVGVLDLKLLLSSLKSIPSEEVDITFNDKRIDLYGGGVGFNLLTCAPTYISTHKSEEHLKKILDFADSGEQASARITPEVLSKYTSVRNVLKSEYTTINVSQGGVQFVLGSSTENEAIVELENESTIHEFTVKLPSNVFASSLALMVGGELKFTGKDSLVVFVDENKQYTYIVSPITG